MWLNVVSFHEVSVKGSSFSAGVFVAVGFWTRSLVEFAKSWVRKCPGVRYLILEILLNRLFLQFLQLSFNWRLFHLLYFLWPWFYKRVGSFGILCFGQLLLVLLLLVMRDLKADLLFRLLSLSVGVGCFRWIIETRFKGLVMFLFIGIRRVIDLLFPRQKTPSNSEAELHLVWVVSLGLLETSFVERKYSILLSVILCYHNMFILFIWGIAKASLLHKPWNLRV